MSLGPRNANRARRILVVRSALRQRQASRRGGTGVMIAAVTGLVVLLLSGLLLSVVGTAAVGTSAFQVLTSPNPTDLAALSRSALPQTTRIYDRTGTHVLATIYTQDRDYVTFDQIPTSVVNATVSIEDRGFWTNPGVSLTSIARAALNDVSGGRLQGASTITEQLVKMLITGSQPTLQRKIREALLGVQASEALSKQQIMELYLNTVPYGDQAYGIAAAARHYFSENLDQVTLAQAALLAGLPQAPSSLDPFVNLPGALARQHQVLQAMVSTKDITPAQMAAAEAAPLHLKQWVPAAPAVPWFSNRVIAEASQMMGGYDKVATCGCKIITTLDWGLQQIAQRDVTNFVTGLPKYLNVHNGALVAQDPATGQILAYVGSVNPKDNSVFVDGQFDSAGAALRSPGSTWKLVTYLAAMQYGHLTDTSTLWDVPVQLAPGFVGTNDEGNYNGPITIRQAIRESRNVPAMEAMLAYGGVSNMEQMAYKLGLTTPFQSWEDGPALAIGAHSTTLSQMVEIYATEANLGTRVTQNDIIRIENPNGSTIVPKITRTQVVNPALAWEFLSVLQDNANRNKGWLDGPYGDIGRPAAVKTGTEANFRDLYAVGMVPQLVAGDWMGNANESPINSGLQSNIGSLMLWHNFMLDAVKYMKYKPIDWTRPSELVPEKVCANLGEFAGYGFDVNGPGCPFGTAISYVIPGFNDQATIEKLRPMPFGTFLTDGRGHLLPSRCTIGIPETGIVARAPDPAWQPYLDAWVQKARQGQENHGGYNGQEVFPWSSTNWLLPPVSSSCAVYANAPPVPTPPTSGGAPPTAQPTPTPALTPAATPTATATPAPERTTPPKPAPTPAG